MEELVMIGFTDILRAVEVLPQLQRLKFDWTTDLRTAIAVQVEQNGMLRLHHSELLDPAHGLNDALRWKAILSAIVPLPHIPFKTSAETSLQVLRINAESGNLLQENYFDANFMRDAAAVLRPGNSAILAILRESEAAFPILLGYSHLVLHTRVSSHGSEKP
jgi:uncharacterized membrane protein